MYHLYLYMYLYTNSSHTALLGNPCKEKQSPSTITWRENNPNILRGAIMMSPHNAIHSKRSCLKCCLYHAITFFQSWFMNACFQRIFFITIIWFYNFWGGGEGLKVYKCLFRKNWRTSKMTVQRMIEYRKQHELLWGRPQSFVIFWVPLYIVCVIWADVGVH